MKNEKYVFYHKISKRIEPDQSIPYRPFSLELSIHLLVSMIPRQTINPQNYIQELGKAYMVEGILGEKIYLDQFSLAGLGIERGYVGTTTGDPSSLAFI